MTESNKRPLISLNTARRYLKYNGPVYVKPKVINQKAFKTWAENMKVVDFK